MKHSFPHILLLTTFAALSACSLNYDFTECESDRDCDAYERPQEGRFLTCSSDNRCIPLEDVECRNTSHCDPGQICNDNRCQPVCDSDATCRDRLGPNGTCTDDGRCLGVKTAACTEEITIAEGQGDPHYIGSIFHGTNAGQSTAYELGIQQLAADLEQADLQFSDGRPVHWVRCRLDNSDADTAAVTRHLETIDAAAVIGPARTELFTRAATDVAAPNDLPLISPDARAPTADSLASFGETSFSTHPGAELAATALADWGLDRVARDGTDRALVFYPDSDAGRALRDELTGDFDQSLSTVSVASHAYTPAWQLSNDRSERLDVYDTRAREILPDSAADLPELAFALGGEGASEFALSYRAAAVSSFDSPPSLSVLFGFGGAGEGAEYLEAATDQWQVLPTDVAGTATRLADRSILQSFASRVSPPFTSQTDLRRAAFAYDAAALATIALMTGTVDDGATADIRDAIATAIRGGRLDATAATDIPLDGPSAFTDAQSTLSAGEGVDLQGLATDLDLSQTGRPPAPVVGLEPGLDDSGADPIATRLYPELDAGGDSSWQPIIPTGDRGARAEFSTDTQIPPGSSNVAWRPSVSHCPTARLIKTSLQLDHPAPDQLTVTLTTPSGDSTAAFDGGTPPGAITADVPDNYLPTDWSEIYGADASGEWSLRLSDGRDSGSDGQLTAASVSWYCAAPIP